MRRHSDGLDHGHGAEGKRRLIDEVECDESHRGTKRGKDHHNGAQTPFRRRREQYLR